MIKDMTVLVRKSKSKKSIVPSWNGGRMPLSANLGMMLRRKFHEAMSGKAREPEISILQPLFELQQMLSHIPRENELLMEQIQTEDGYHLFVYPFEGRLVHEVMAMLLAWRISQRHPITFSIAMNDYGFELLSDQPIPVDDSDADELFSLDNLTADLQSSVNATEMARRKFRDISVIAGLVFQGTRENRRRTGICNLRLLCCLKCSRIMTRRIYLSARRITKLSFTRWKKRGCAKRWSGYNRARSSSLFHSV